MRAQTYLTIYRDLYQDITEGHLQPGMALPSEHELSLRYSISRPTIRKAIKMLADQSLIIRKQGIGSVVASTQHTRSLTIGVDLASTYEPHQDYYFPKIYRGIHHVLEQGGHKMYLLPPKANLEQIADEVDGFILTTADTDRQFYQNLTRIALNGTPVVMLNRIPSQRELSYLAVDFQQETVKAIALLLKNGIQNILMYAPSASYCSTFIPRVNGFRLAFKQAGLEVPQDLIIDGSTPNQEKQLLEILQKRRVQVLFTACGQELFAAMRAVLLAKLNVPEDISIFCFDDMELFSQQHHVPLSFIKMPLEHMGEMAADYLIRKKANPTLPPLHQIFNTSLVLNGCSFLEQK